jgi:hypothetical protein
MDYVLLQFVRVAFFMNKLALHLERSPLIHGYGYESADDRPTYLARLFVSSMRLTPSGLTRYFVPDKILPLKSKSFMQYAGIIICLA